MLKIERILERAEEVRPGSKEYFQSQTYLRALIAAAMTELSEQQHQELMKQKDYLSAMLEDISDFCKGKMRSESPLKLAYADILMMVNKWQRRVVERFDGEIDVA